MLDRNITRRAVLRLAPAAATLAAFGTAHAQSAGTKSLKLGAICSVTGPNASIGREGLAGLDYAVKATNAAGGVCIGADTCTLSLSNVDDQSKAERAVAAAEQLIGEDHVPVIFTPPASTATLAMLPTIEKNKVVAMSYVASAPAVTGPEFSYSFRSTLNALDNVNPSIDFLVKQQSVKTIAYLGRNDDWGRSAGRALAARAQQLGAKLVVEEYFDTSTTDFFSLLSVVVIWSSPVFLNAVGKAAEGIYIATGPRTSGTPEIQAFTPQFQKTTGHAPLPYELTAYDALNIVLAAMQKAGSADPTAVRAAMRQLDYKGLLQEYAFNGRNQSTVVININKVSDGAVVPITSINT